MIRLTISFVLALLLCQVSLYSQTCDSLVPSYQVNLTADNDSVWISPVSARDGYCCSATGADKCVEFKVTIAPSAMGVTLQIHSGAIAGALYTFVNCDSVYTFGDTIPLTPGITHDITFCKPGTSLFSYRITSIPEPTGNKGQAESYNLIYPNPSTDYITISQDLNSTDYQIVDINGKLVSTGIIHSGTINTSGLQPGIYFIALTNTGGSVSRYRFMKR